MIYFLYGPNTFLLKRYLKELQNRAGEKLLRFDLTQELTQDIIAEIKNPSLFASHKVIIYQGAIGPTQVKFFNQIKALADKAVEFKNFGSAELRRWVGKELADYKFKADFEAIELLVRFANSNLWQLEQDIKKLAAILPSGCLTKAEVLAHIRPSFEVDIFKTLEYLASRNKAETLRHVHQHLARGMHPLYLLKMLVWQWRLLLMVKQARQQKVTAPRLSKILKIKPYPLAKSSALASYFTFEQLKKHYQLLWRLDQQVKLGRIKPEQALEIFAVQV